MSKVRKRFEKGIRILEDDLTSEDLSQKGEIAIDSNDSKLKYRDDSATREVADTDSAQTLENKTIDATAASGNNTISMDADDVVYDNAASGLTATDVKAALDELKTGLDNQNEASELEYDNSISGLAATNVQAALDEIDGDLDAHVAATSAHGVSGDVVGTIDAQTLTNKTIDADNNTISNLAHGAEVDNPTSGVHGVTGNIVGDSDAQTLTNKTLGTGIVFDEPSDHGVVTVSFTGEGNIDPTKGVIRVTNASGITGLIAGQNERAIIINKTGGALFLRNESGSVLSSQQILTGIGEDLELSPDASVLVQYNTTDSKWNVVGGAGLVDAVDVSYDNSTSGLAATDVQTAIDEVDSDLDNHIAATSAHGTTGDVVGTSDTQALTNKDIDGGTASDTSRITLPQDTKTNLDALTRKEGTLVYANDQDKLYIDNGTSLLDVSKGGGLDVYYTQDMEGLANTSSFSRGNNATFLGGGVLAGTLAIETVNPISGDNSLSYTQAAGSLNDYFASEIIEIDNKQQNNDSGMTFYFQYDGNDNDLKFVVYDVTNSTELTSGVELVKTSTKSQRYALSFYVPATCTQIRWGAQVLVENIGAVLLVDDVEITSNPFVYKNLVDPRTVVRGAGNGGESITANVTDIPFTEVEDELGLWDGDSFTAQEDGDYLVAGSIIYTAPVTTRGLIFVDGVFELNAGTDVSSTRHGVNAIVTLSAGEVLTIRAGGGGTLANDPQNHWIHIQKIPESTEHVITPAKSSSEDYLDYRGTVTSGLDNLATVSGSAEATQFTLKRKCFVFLKMSQTLVTNSNGQVINIRIDGDVKSSSITSADGAKTWSNVASYFGEVEEGSVISFNGMANGLNTEISLQLVDFDSKILAAIPTPKTAYIKDVKPSGTAGGTFTSGAWQTRDLNTLEGDTGFVSLSGNQVTIAPGKYKIKASAPANQVNNHQSKLRNITDGVDQLLGVSTYCPSGTAVQNESNIKGTITLTSTKVFEIQHQCTVSKATDGFGRTASFGVDELYTILEIEKIG